MSEIFFSLDELGQAWPKWNEDENEQRERLYVSRMMVSPSFRLPISYFIIHTSCFISVPYDDRESGTGRTCGKAKSMKDEVRREAWENGLGVRGLGGAMCSSVSRLSPLVLFSYFIIHPSYFSCCRLGREAVLRTL